MPCRKKNLHEVPFQDHLAVHVSGLTYSYTRHKEPRPNSSSLLVSLIASAATNTTIILGIGSKWPEQIEQANLQPFFTTNADRTIWHNKLQ
jgi:hypothetical protein